MFLVVDIGNSNMAWGLFEASQFLTQWRSETIPRASAAELVKELRKGLHAANIPSGAVDGVVIGSVVPSIDAPMAAAVEQVIGRTPLFIDHTNAGVAIKYPHPEEVGADRLVDAAGALATCGAPCIVVDFGTATTFDYIDPDGAYCGGPIAPGLAISNTALTAAAEKLQPTPIAPTDRLLPQSTTEAIQAGVFHGYVGLTRHLLERLVAEVGTHPKIIATGGLAELLSPHCRGVDIVDPTLTLTGLRVIWERQ